VGRRGRRGQAGRPRRPSRASPERRCPTSSFRQSFNVALVAAAVGVAHAVAGNDADKSAAPSSGPTGPQYHRPSSHERLRRGCSFATRLRHYNGAWWTDTTLGVRPSCGMNGFPSFHRLLAKG
jgi:hypothetical protein